MIPSVGRIVYYRLGQSDVNEINNRRSSRQERGNAPSEGDVCPMMIVKVWGESQREDELVNGQVFLDGDDQIWVTSRKQGTDAGQWSDPRSS